MHFGNFCTYILLSVFLKLLERFVIMKLLKLQLVTKFVETLCFSGPLSLSPVPRRGTKRPLLGREAIFRLFTAFARRKQSLPYPPPPFCCATVWATCRKQQTSQLWTERRWEGCGLFLCLTNILSPIVSSGFNKKFQ